MLQMMGTYLIIQIGGVLIFHPYKYVPTCNVICHQLFSLLSEKVQKYLEVLQIHLALTISNILGSVLLHALLKFHLALSFQVCSFVFCSLLNLSWK